MTKGLYIHIPFCDQICTYCDFPRIITKVGQQEAYLNALIKELKDYEQTIGFANLQTLYIGGGTPTALTVQQLTKLFAYLKQSLSFTSLKEISIEANPENLTKAKIDFLLSQGITRISLGVQTFNEKLLKQIGRNHTGKAAMQVIKQLQKSGFKNINLDMIYGIPGQTLMQVERDLEIALDLDVPHISAYSLIVEEHTPLYLAHRKNQLSLIDNELEAKMYEVIMNTLIANGFQHYEISNFTKGAPSFHNLLYWQNEEYIGVGLGAHGYLKGRRYYNTRSINKYLQLKPRVEEFKLSQTEKIEECLFLGLRLMQGLEISAVNQKYQISIEELYQTTLKKFTEQGYLEIKEGWLRLTRQGILMANEVFAAFLLDELS